MYKILRGDKSDNIPPVPRFPSALALDLVQRCATLKEFSKALAEGDFPERYAKWRGRVKQYRDLIKMNAFLVLPKAITESLLVKEECQYDEAALRDLMQSRGLESLLSNRELFRV
jgi:5'-3' exonuclease